MSGVFISFASYDAKRVTRIRAQLIARGFDVWWMHNLLPGESPIQTVSRELVAAKSVLLAWSRSASESPYARSERHPRDVLIIVQDVSAAAPGCAWRNGRSELERRRRVVQRLDVLRIEP
jgi:hypothetical protein